MKNSLFWINIFLTLFLYLGCKETRFSGWLKPQEAVPLPPPPPTPVFLKLNVISVRPDAWWKNCLYVIHNGNESSAYKIGCSKDTGLIGKEIVIQAFPENCNSLRFVVNVHQNTNNCSKASECVLSESPTCQRSSARKKDAPFFLFSEARKLNQIDKKVSLEDRFVFDSNAKLFEKAQMVDSSVRILRMFFEDQDDKNLKQFEQDRQSADGNVRASARERLGIDFNDVIFDLETQRIDVAVEGTEFGCTKPLPVSFKPAENLDGGGCEINNLRDLPAKIPK
jgi:hypothetical protein